ncbi:MAG TPA: DUF3667 domain-containing protein [Chitinophagaceae bacterium]|nr:DUF3667 domain-containing protein [Chitinophagaceae bacterium]
MIICLNCGTEGDQKYCPGCGQALQIERISINSLLHEVAHTFWHLEKGFLYTLKELAINPGTTQRKYLSGIRLRYQKPFPLFAISVTICALALFFISRNTPNTGNIANQSVQVFYKHYWFMVQAAMLPSFALITYLLFKSRELYYAEALVMNVYLLGFTSVCIIPINALSFFLPNLVIDLLEVILLITYNIWTNLNFFKGKVVWWIIVKSIVGIIVSYLLFNITSNLVMQWFT